MSNATVFRVGQINGSGDADATFLKLFAGEVLTAFNVANVMLPLVTTRTIKGGKSAQFPVTGQFAAAYHTVGNEILGTTTNASEVVITIDDLLIAHTFLANIDEAKAQFDVRSAYTKELGIALAQQLDKHLIQLQVLAARASGTVTGRSGGSIIYQDNANVPGSSLFKTNGSHLAAAIFAAAQELDEKGVPEDDRYCVVKPAQYYNMVKTTDIINKDWGGKGAYAEGEVLKVAGIHIIKSPHLPVANVSNGTVGAGTGNKYAGTFADTAGVVFHKGSVGTVKLFDIGMDMGYDMRRQGTLAVAKYAMGHGILRPEGAVEIRAANAP